MLLLLIYLMRYITVTLAYLLYALPQTAGAAGLVPCGGTGQAPCQTCDLVVLSNNILLWIFGILALIAGIVIIYAGFVMVTSRGDASLIQQAKRYLTNIFIGLVIVFAAWFIVDTVGEYLLDVNTSWNLLECVAQPAFVTERLEPLNLVQLNYAQAVTVCGQASGSVAELQATGCNVTECTPGPNVNCDDFCSGEGARAVADSSSPSGFSCVNTPPPPAGVNAQAGTCEAPPSGPCSAEALRNQGFGNLADAAAQISSAESGCNTRAESGTDRTEDGRTYSFGVWQINIAAHRMSCNGQTLDCPSAFVDTGRRNQYNIRIQRVVNEPLYQACRAAALNPDCNSQTAARLATASGDMGDWACSAVKCGIYTTRNSSCRLTR
jgi:hypothetical protein